jgi:predicted transcriptional regulator
MKPKFSATNAPIMIKALMSKPHTPVQLAEASGFSMETVNLFCDSMHKAGLIYIVDWVYERNRYLPAYIFGEGMDVTDKYTTAQKRILDVFRRDLLSHTAQEVSDMVGIPKSTITKELNALTEKRFIYRNPRKNGNDPLTWRRDASVAFPIFADAVKYVPKRPTPQRPKLPKQSWFSAITN